MLADLHSHSYYSDGIFSPTQLVNMAKNANCDLFSLSDHDTTAGINEAQKTAKDINLNFINGVEISASWRNTTIHILGLGIDINNHILQKGLKQHQDFRSTRAQKIANSLEAAGISNAMDKTLKFVKKSMITRTHFARMLVANGICKNNASVFKRYLVNNKPGFVTGSWSSLEDVVSWVKLSGGLSVVAHPCRYRMTKTKIQQLLVDFKECGGDGIEIITSNTSLAEINYIDKLSQDIELLHSFGSDFHGDNSYVEIGKLKKSINSNKAIWRYL